MEKKVYRGLQFGRLLYLMLLVAAGALVVGGYPTYRYTRWVGVASAGLATVVVLAVMLLSGMFVLRVERKKGGFAAAQAFFAASGIRVPLVIGLALAVRWGFRLPAAPLLLWVVFLFLLLVVTECLWLTMGIKSQEEHEFRTQHPGFGEPPPARF